MFPLSLVPYVWLAKQFRLAVVPSFSHFLKVEWAMLHELIKLCFKLLYDFIAGLSGVFRSNVVADVLQQTPESFVVQLYLYCD